MYVCLITYVEAEEEIRSLELQRGSCEPLRVGNGNWTQISGETVLTYPLSPSSYGSKYRDRHSTHCSPSSWEAETGTESSRPAWSYIVRPHQSVWHLVGAQKAFVVHHVSSIDSSGLAFLYQLCACPGLSLLRHQVHGSWCCGPCWSSDSPTTQCPRRTCCKWKGSEGGALWDPECSLLLENFDAFSTSNLQGKGLRIQTRTL